MAALTWLASLMTPSHSLVSFMGDLGYLKGARKASGPQFGAALSQKKGYFAV